MRLIHNLGNCISVLTLFSSRGPTWFRHETSLSSRHVFAFMKHFEAHAELANVS